MKRIKTLLILLLCSFLIAACGNNPIDTSHLSTQDTIAQTATLAPTPTATEVPLRVLNICMAEEPSGLYRYDGKAGIAKQSVFAAIYLNLFETEEATGQSLFFENIPGEANGGILIQPVTVRVGQPIVNSAGAVVYLSEGTTIEHAINYSIENPVVWNYEQDYQMNQFTVTFKLRPDLRWSDGEALTAADFVFSYHLAERSELGHYQWALDRTSSFIAADEHTLVWTGIPGFVPGKLEDILWQPLPVHQLADLSDAELLSSDLTTTSPLGWGAFNILNWEPGKQIVLEKNPYFVLAGQNLPAFERVNFQIEADLDTALQKLENGQCDLLDSTYHLESLDKNQLDSLQAQNRLVTENWQPVQQLVFGIKPALFDDGSYNPWTSQRQDIFGGIETRKAIAACIDADGLVSEYLAEHLPENLVPLLNSTVSENLDPNTLLEEIGWILTDGDEGVVRVARGVPNVLDGTPLVFGLSVGQSQADQQIAEKIQDRLGRCYVPVAKVSMPLAELYRPGPDGALFGRNFNLALISWQPEHMNICQLYTSDQVPSSINSWVGTNIAGFSSVEFDEACYQISTRLPLGDEVADAALMAEYLPAISLIPQYRIWAVSKRLSLPEVFLMEDFWKLAILSME
mgnify:CR=1 FL=1